MDATLVAVGIVVQAVVWRLAALERLPFWPATTATFTALGIAALLAGEPACCAATTAAGSAAVGAASGSLLFVATRAVVGIATRYPSLRGAVAGIYRRSEETPVALAFVVTLAVAVPGEELFWRGLVQPELGNATAPLLGAVLAWLGYVGVNAASASLPLLAGSVVGGAVWTTLAVWSHGVVAPIASHVVWTGLMLAWPPAAARGKVSQ